MTRPATLPCLLACLVLATAIAPRSRAQEPVRRIELGEGVAVEACPRARSAFEPPQCWQPVGFAFGSYVVLGRARTFARAPLGSATRGRLFAVIPDNVSQLGTGHVAPVVFTDDLGARWQESRWDPATGSPTLGAYSPLALSIDPEGLRVVAAGEYARLWVSRDGGQSFVQRRSGGQTYVSVEVLGRATVLTDADGRVWSTPDDGESLRAITSERGATVTREERAIVVRHGSRTIRIDPSGTVH